MSVPAVWFAASIAANVILIVLFAIFALSRGETKASPGAAREQGGEEDWETRIERLEVLWYPKVTYSPTLKVVVKTIPGVPHCKKCALALVLSKEKEKGWVCPQCQDHFVESLADVAILDLVGKQALKYFLERHKDFRTT